MPGRVGHVRAGQEEEGCATGAEEQAVGREGMGDTGFKWTNIAVNAPARTAAGVRGKVTYTLRCNLSKK